MDATPASPPDEDTRIEISVVGSPEVYGGEQSIPGNAISEQEEQSIRKEDQSPSRSEIVIMESGEVPQDVVQLPVLDQLKMWQWVFIDGMQLPALIRGGELLLAVHNVQLKLLSRFPPRSLSKDVLSKYTMVSHRMTAMEAWTLNAINATVRKLDLGCQLFTPEDEVVSLADVESFYWNVKSINLAYMVQRYDEEGKKSNDNISLMAVITAIRHTIEAEIEECRVHINRLNSENGHMSMPKTSPPSSVPQECPSEPKMNVYL